MRRVISILCIFCLGFLVWPAGPGLAAGSLEMVVEPPNLDVDMFFTGGRVNITGLIPAGDDVVIELTGPVVKVQYDIKGRVGPFWMNRQTVHLEKVPSLYALLVPAGDGWEEKLPELGLGFGQLKKGIEVGRTELSPEEIMEMYMDLKKSEGLYSQQFGAVTYSAEKDGQKKFETDYDFPSSAVTGHYAVKAFVLENGAVTGEYSKDLEVREKGFVKLIDEMASNQRLLYGVMAVVIALLAGGVMGVLFKGGGSH